MRIRAASSLVAFALLVSPVHAGGLADPVEAVWPSGDVVPEQLLRISVAFSRPHWHGLAVPLVLERGNGDIIEGALLNDVLWSPDRRTATVLLRPGRVKTGLIAHQAAGWALPVGQNVNLVYGHTIVHRWHVVDGGCVVPAPMNWSFHPPKAGTLEPLVLEFPAPIDGLSNDLIGIADSAGDRIGGSAHLENGERRWRFIPDLPWPRGTLDLVVHPRIESPCGDEPDEAFEHPAGTGLGAARSQIRIPMGMPVAGR